jgi:molybdopterin-biosynthesis enzyme MoeA-like protein
MIENCKMYLEKGLKIHSKTINLYTVESNISKKLGQIQKKYKKNVDIGSYPFFRLGKIGVAIVTRSSSLSKLKIVNNDLLILAREKKIKILKV